MSGPGVQRNIHASCLMLGAMGAAFEAPADAGVLLLGESGAGKSITLLQCLGRGARLVADDRCLLSWQGGGLYAAAPATLSGMIEVRGLGILRLPFEPRARITLAVRLEAGPRLPEPEVFIPEGLEMGAGGNAPPLIRLKAENGIVDKIAVAVAAYSRNLFCQKANSPPPKA